MGELFNQSGLIEMKTAMYKADFELNAQLLASFPNPGDEIKIRNMVTDDIGKNELGIDARLVGNEVHYSVPIMIIAGKVRPTR